MKHTEGSFKGQKDLNLYYQSWQQAQAPKAILLVVHGFAEHSGRYMNIVNYFVPKGYAVYGLDHRGHGRSEGLRGYVERFSYYLDDLKTFFDIVHGEYDNTKTFIVGHSMGGAIATVYAIEHQDEFDGLILSGAGLKIGNGSFRVLTPMVRVLSLFLPKVGITIIDTSTISQDQAVVEAYVNDPLVYWGKVRARFGSELAMAMQKLPHQMSQIALPILIMHGTADRLVKPEGSRELYAKVSSKDKVLKLYDGFYHEIFNEPGRERVFQDMERWLVTHL